MYTELSIIFFTLAFAMFVLVVQDISALVVQWLAIPDVPLEGQPGIVKVAHRANGFLSKLYTLSKLAVVLSVAMLVLKLGFAFH